MKIVLSLKDFCNLIPVDGILEEKKQGIDHGVPYRIDPPSAYKNQQYHIHVGDYTWNIDGSRSHRSK